MFIVTRGVFYSPLPDDRFIILPPLLLVMASLTPSLIGDVVLLGSHGHSNKNFTDIRTLLLKLGAHWVTNGHRDDGYQICYLIDYNRIFSWSNICDSHF